MMSQKGQVNLFPYFRGSRSHFGHCDQVSLENTPLWHNPEIRDFFHLALLRHQNIKTSLNFLEENHWSRPFFALFRSVREKLQLTVSLNHPVVTHFKGEADSVQSLCGA